MGVRTRHVFAMTMAVALVVTAIGGVVLGIRTQFDPSLGPTRLIYAFEAVVIGGLGSLWGTLAGGIVLGVCSERGVVPHIPVGQSLPGTWCSFSCWRYGRSGLFGRAEA